MEVVMGKLVEVVIDSLRVSLTNQQRVVVLHEKETENYLPIWIGPYEAEAITIALQEVEVSRPLTHDLLKNVFSRLHGRLQRIEVAELKDDVFYAHIITEQDGETIAIDARPSDAIALAVRAHIPIYVDTEVMAKAGVHPDVEIDEQQSPESPVEDMPAGEGGSEGRLSIFEDFLNKLDLDETNPDEDEDGGNKE
jgi:bifunctional DNase/RNase